jgi:hypothetical protein
MCDLVRHHVSRIVPGALVLRPGVAQTNDDP